MITFWEPILSILHLIKPVSHNSPVYPGLQPVSHLPVVLLQGMSPIQWPLQLYPQSDPNVPNGHSKKNDLWYWPKFMMHISNNNDQNYKLLRNNLRMNSIATKFIREQTGLYSLRFIYSRVIYCCIINYLPSVQFSPVHPS